MSDTVFNSGNITITATMAKFGDTSYPISNIGAVSIEETPSPVGGYGALLIVGGIISGLIGAALIWKFSGKVSSAKLMLRTSSGNEQAFEADDVNQVKKIKSSIEEAIALRG